MPLQQTLGNVTADAYGGGAAVEPVYIEQIFSTYLYTGNGSTQTINNGIDLLGKGGLVWVKNRTGYSHCLIDTARGRGSILYTNLTWAAGSTGSTNDVTAFNSDGFSLGTNNQANVNSSTEPYASWTFRKQPKFFDVVTYTGNGATTRNISHNLGSTPGFILVKCTSTTGSWAGYHRSLGATYVVLLNSTSAAIAGTPIWDSTEPTSTQFTVNDNSFVNTNGTTYVAYLFAHNAGGFGLTGTDNVISCGSYTGNGLADGPTITLGYEPQYLLVKNASSTGNWIITDNMRGFTNGSVDPDLSANTSSAENAYLGGSAWVSPTATGFKLEDNGITNNSGQTYIYIAIRRPMKVPTSGTSVFSPVSRDGTSAMASITTPNFPPDLVMIKNQTGVIAGRVRTKLTGPNARLVTSSTDPEVSDSDQFKSFDQLGYTFGANSASDFGTQNYSGYTYVNWAFKRAPGFFDVVCYTGTGSATTFNHNLGVAPQLVIVKWRSGATGEDWPTMCTAASSSPDKRLLYLDLTAAGGGLNGMFADSSGTPVLPTSTQVYIGTNSAVNGSTATYVAYLFATCPGVSKVGSYTGNGSSQTINCGFTGGARFVLIKRTDSTGDWYVWDSARGIVASNDPHLSLNTTAAEVTTDDSVDVDSSGFIVNQVSATNINVSSATYIFLSVA